MLEKSLSQLEQLVSDLVRANQTLQSSNLQLTAELALAKDENETLQLNALEQEELQSTTAARLQALVELATASNAAPSLASA